MPYSNIRRYLKHGTLPQIAVFEAIARLGSFTRAAAELHIAQPTVSTQIRKLTDTIGVPLFEQFGRRVYLTAAGRALFAACNDLFGTLTRVEQTLTDLRGGQSGRLALAAGSGARFVSRLLAEFTQRYPGIDVSLQLGNRLELGRRLAGNEDDLYLFTTPPEAGVVTQALLPNPLVVCARADHALAHARRIPLQQLLHEPFLMREIGSGTRLATERAFERLGQQPRISVVVSSDEAVRQAIRDGLGLSIVSQHTLGFDTTKEAGLVALDVVGFPLPRKWYFVYPTGKSLSAPARAFIDLACVWAGRMQRREAPRLAG